VKRTNFHLACLLIFSDPKIEFFSSATATALRWFHEMGASKYFSTVPINFF